MKSFQKKSLKNEKIVFGLKTKYKFPCWSRRAVRGQVHCPWSRSSAILMKIQFVLNLSLKRSIKLGYQNGG